MRDIFSLSRKKLLFGIPLIAGLVLGSVQSNSPEQTAVYHTPQQQDNPQPIKQTAELNPNSIQPTTILTTAPITPVASVPQTVNQVSNPGSSPSPCH